MGWRVSRVRVFENGSECRRRAAGAAGVRTFADIEYLGPSITLGVAISESIGLTFVSISGIDLRAAHVLPPVGLDCDHRSTTLGDLHHILLLIVDDIERFSIDIFVSTVSTVSTITATLVRPREFVFALHNLRI